MQAARAVGINKLVIQGDSFITIQQVWLLPIQLLLQNCAAQSVEWVEKTFIRVTPETSESLHLSWQRWHGIVKKLQLEDVRLLTAIKIWNRPCIILQQCMAWLKAESLYDCHGLLLRLEVSPFLRMTRRSSFHSVDDHHCLNRIMKSNAGYWLVCSRQDHSTYPAKLVWSCQLS